MAGMQERILYTVIFREDSLDEDRSPASLDNFFGKLNRLMRKLSAQMRQML